MRFFFHLVFAAWLALSPARAATITGRVHAEGKPGTDQPAPRGNYGSRALKFAERVNYAEMRDFVVYIEGKVGTNQTARLPSPGVWEISQKNATFTPHVLPVMVGATVKWPNHDSIYHNVFSFSEARQFDLGLYQNPDVGCVTFDKPGRVDVFCSIHSAMNCIVLVLENPYFCATDANGFYRISNIPAGTYKLKAWHERLPSQVREISVTDTGVLKVDFTLGIFNLPKS
jgi:plastocyanin